MERLVPGDPGVVHEDVDLPELVRGGLGHLLRLFELDGVVGGDLSLAPGVLHGLRGLLGGLGVDVVHHDGGTLLRQPKGRGPADPSAGSGDDRHLSFQSAQDEFLLRLGCGDST